MMLSAMLQQSADSGLCILNKDGSMPFDRNGPWQENVTHVRCTAHWIIQYYTAYKISGLDKYRQAYEKCAAFLLSKSARPFNKAFLCRLEKKKDQVNGLVGQAWAAEALLEISTEKKDTKYLEAAEELISLHPYNHKLNLWHTIDLYGNPSKVSRTLNQQIFFSAIALMTAERTANSELKRNSEKFFKNLPKIVLAGKNNIPNHRLRLSFSKSFTSSIFWRQFVKFKSPEELNLGYVSFILYGLALVKYGCPESQIWKDQRLVGWIKAVLTNVENQFPFGLMESEKSFRWSYNVTGFEISFAIQQFGNANEKDRESSIKWWRAQAANYWDKNQYFLCRNTIDPVVLSARFYQACRLKEIYSLINPCKEEADNG